MSKFIQTDWRKPLQNSVRAADESLEIRTEYFLNKNLEHCPVALRYHL
jgi:hypothetical protein